MVISGDFGIRVRPPVPLEMLLCQPACQKPIFALAELFTAIEKLEDPRSSVNRLHPHVSCVSIAVLAVLCGADGPTNIRAWAVAGKRLLQTFLDLRGGLPSRDVFRRMSYALQPAAFLGGFNFGLMR